MSHHMSSNNMNNKNKVNNSATIAFTLPISCQICLGKVKQPVVCSNQHVFCGPCMDVWLQRNQQCPTCRVPVSSENPVRHVLGGLSSQVDDADKFSNRELRRARMELIYKDYEELISQFENELQTSKQENKEMELRLQAHAYSDSRSKPSSPPDKTLIISLNNKIKDATTLYDQVKGEMKGLKEENTVLRNKNEDLSRENRTLRLELVNRSPRRHGRFTVTALETQLENSEKQVKQLQKALEKTDSYIEELEKELNMYRKKSKDKVKDSLDLDSTINPDDSTDMPSQISSVSDDNFEFRFRDTGKKKRLERSIDEDKSSFDLELPSPMTSVSKDFLNDSELTDDSFLAVRGKADLCKKKLRFTLPPSSQPPNKPILKTKSEPAESALNISMTPEMEDCMRLMDEAEKKLEMNRQPFSRDPPATSFPLTFQPVSSTWSSASLGPCTTQSTFSLAPSVSSASSVVHGYAATTALLLEPSSASLSQPMAPPTTSSIPGFSYHLSQ